MAKRASGDLSLTSTSSQEEESPEYGGYDRTLRPSSNSSGSSPSGTTNMASIANSNNNNTNNINSTGNATNNSSNNSNNTNPNAKKYDVPKTQYGSALLELNTLRLQHSETMRHCDDLAKKLAFYQEQYMSVVNQMKSTDRNKFTDVAAENARLKQQNSLLERKLIQLQNENGNTQGTPNAYYCDYGDVSNRSKCDGSFSENEKLLDELHLCKERNAELIKERNMIAAEREKYKQKLGSAYTELENVRIQLGIMEKESQKLNTLLSTEANKVLMITMNRNRIEEELNQLLSEKDNVLQEHQKMSDDLSAANKELERLKKEELIYKNEIKMLQQANSEFKKRDLLKSRESSWSKEFSDSKDDFKELEKLRKGLEKARSEVDRAVQDAEEAKRVRDWAISQREKIVQERDSVKTLCDNLRKERDKAISDLLSAIRDSEKIKKQKDEAQKKIDVLKEQIENQNMDSVSRRSFRMSTYEAEDMLDIELCNYHADSDIGLILDDTNSRQLVCGVTNNSPAFGKLKINDVICKVNGLECQTMTKRMVLDEIRASAPRCNLLVSRTRHSKRHFYTVHLNLQDNPNHGLNLDTGVFISKIEANSLAAFEPELDVGDRVLSINNKSMEGIQSVDSAMNLLNDERNESITIFALKNVQEAGYGENQRRMTTSSAQTDSIDSMHRVTSAKHPSIIAEMLSKFKVKKHSSKTGSDADAPENDALNQFDSVINAFDGSSTTEKSKKKKSKKDKEAKPMGTWPRVSIQNATAENPTGTIVQKERKRPQLSLFTPINVDKDDERDTSDEPPPLPPPTKPQTNIRNGNFNTVKNNPNRNSNPIPVSMLMPPAHTAHTAHNAHNAANSNSNSGNFMRHSVYGVTTSMEQEPIVMEQNKSLQRPRQNMGPPMRPKVLSNDASQRPHNFPNRYSLNITPEYYRSTGQQAQQQVINAGNHMDFPMRKQLPFDTNMTKSTPHPSVFSPHNMQINQNFVRSSSATQQNSLDMISIKSQNSIDSILSSTKSPPISEYVVPNYPKRPMPQAPTPGVKNVAKYPSDSESIASGIISGGGVVSSGGGCGSGIGMGMGVGLFHTNNAPPSRHTQLFPTFTQQTSHLHGMRQIRHSSPLTLPSPPPLQPQPHPHANATHVNMETASGSAIGIPTSSVNNFELEYVSPSHNHHPHSYLQEPMYPPPPPVSTHPHHAHYHPHSGVSGGGVGVGVGGVIYEGGTFPRKKDHQRLRIPLNPSVASKNSGVKNSSGSIDHHFGGVSNTIPNMSAPPLVHHSAVSNATANGGGSGRGSPMPQVHVEVLNHGSKRNSNVPADFLCPGDLRRVTIEKSDKSLGITIQCNNNGGGIFVSTVADKSIATRAGLQVGDQLLEVCGLNMRSATNDIAANVLRQCGNSITMLVQYNPEKFHSAEYDGTNNIEPESPVNHSGSPTPRNSPRPPVRSIIGSLPPLPMSSPTSESLAQTNIMPQSSSLISTQSIKDQSFADSLENRSDISSNQDITSSTATTTTTTTASTTSTLYEEEARYVTLVMDKSKNLGIKLFGGNKVGIFVHEVHPGSPSDKAGIRKGDQILEYNGVDLRCVTAEQAANEISKLTDTVTMLVQNKFKKLKQIKDKTGDSFYIRVGFDRTGELNEGDLRFVKDEVLYVDNTVLNGTFGLWRAWKLDAKGHRKECGIIPSQMKIEEELRASEMADCEGGNARRGSTSARRSFFRRKKHQRSSSRDSTEIASFSNTQLSFFPDSGMLNEDGGIIGYQRVERLDSPVRRPVLIIGPLSECVMKRLTLDFSNLFKLCEITTMDCSQEAMEEGLQKNIFVDYRRRGIFECITAEAIINACKNDRRHCILDISISAVERLQRLQIYPIVLLLRFKSAKQIREIRDIGTDKISAKVAKEMYERALKLETDYKQYISAVIPGVSIKHMCTQIKDSVDKEQDKLLWVPVSSS